MIAHLSGTLLSKQATSVIVDVGGVGYEVNIPLSTFTTSKTIGSNVQASHLHHVREDALQLYGFKTARERELFLKLISVSGIGPKLGITLAVRHEADEMIASIRTNNLARLTLIPGVGRKTAERLIVELREKVASCRRLNSKRNWARNRKLQSDRRHVRAMRFRFAQSRLPAFRGGESDRRRARRRRRHHSRIDFETRSQETRTGLKTTCLLSQYQRA
jgi:Holliday junction DNA helicase RuvA